MSETVKDVVLMALRAKLAGEIEPLGIPVLVDAALAGIVIDLPSCGGEIEGDTRQFRLWMRTLVRRGRARRYRRISTLARPRFRFRARASRKGKSK